MEVTFNTGLEDIGKRILEKKDKKSKTVWEAYLRKRLEKMKARKNKSKYSSDGESSDTDPEAIEEADDYFVEEPSMEKNKQEARGKNKKEGKQQKDTDMEANASTAELELLLADDKGVENGLKGEIQFETKKSQRGKGERSPRRGTAFYARQVAQRQQKGDWRELISKEPTKSPTNAQFSSDDPEMNDHMKSDASQSKKEKHELSSLVKSLKMKSKQIQLPSNTKMPRKDDDVFQSKA